MNREIESQQRTTIKLSERYMRSFQPDWVNRLYWKEAYRFARTMFRSYKSYGRYICQKTSAREPYNILAFECCQYHWDILQDRQRSKELFNSFDSHYQLKNNPFKNFHKSNLPEWF